MNKPESGFRFIGQPMPRHEDARLIVGQGRFTDDFNFPGQAHAAMVPSPHAHARIISIAKTAALALPGVLGVFTGAGYLDLWAALNNTDLAAGTANSPALQYDAASRSFYLANDTRTAWGSSANWSSSAVWGTNVFVTGSSAIWGTRAISGSSATWGDSAVWGTSAMWGTSAIWGTSAVWGTNREFSDSETLVMSSAR